VIAFTLRVFENSRGLATYELRRCLPAHMGRLWGRGAFALRSLTHASTAARANQ